PSPGTTCVAFLNSEQRVHEASASRNAASVVIGGNVSVMFVQSWRRRPGSGNLSTIAARAL
ncbi:MAG: hypothetical protein WB822_11830, partial [Rhodoplanes sp.]